MFDRIPVEMRRYPHWICWRYEDTDGPKPTKIPYSIHGALASVNDPSTWAAFESAVATAKNNRYSGIGFVLTEHDPYAFIDLDDTNGDSAKLDRQMKVYWEFSSYSERSPSGKGLHVIVKGKIPAGRRRSNIEIYSSQRYMTMTGDVFDDRPIADKQDLLTLLWEQMGGDAATHLYSGESAELYSDAEVIERALKAINGDKFAALLNGQWQQFYPSQSEADFAFVDIIAFYTQNRKQITRLFQSSPLGQRDKAKRQDYIAYMVNKSFDRMLPPVDMDGLRNKLELKLAESRNSASVGTFSAPLANVVAAPTLKTLELPTFDYTIPPGLVGEIAQFMHAASPRPVPEIALAGAIGLMAGICGRAFNISGTGLNMYVLLLAPTGTGKEAMASGMDKLIECVKRTVPAVTDFIGPAEIRSDAALLKYISKASPCFISLVGEFGLMLKQMSSIGASAHQTGLKRILLDLYNKSGQGKTMQPTIYSDREKNTATMNAPSFTLLGESTPERFYEVLDEGMISDGLLPRFLMVEYHGQRPALNEAHQSAKPSSTLIEQLSSLTASCLMLMGQHTAINVKLSPEAQSMLREFDQFCDTKINSTKLEINRQLWTRAHMKALKLAALISVGVNPYEPIVFPNIAHWSIALVCHDIRNLLAKFESGGIGSTTEETKQVDEIIRVIKDYVTTDAAGIGRYLDTLKMHNDRVIPYSYIARRLTATSAFRLDRMGATNAIKRSIAQMLESGWIREVGKHDMAIKYNSSARAFMIAMPHIFGA